MTAADRRVALADLLPNGVDALLVTAPANVRYLTGFTGSNSAVLVGRDSKAVLATDGRYAEQATAQAPDVETLVTRSVGPHLVATAAARGRRRIAIERKHVTLAAHDRLRSAGDVELVGADGLVEALRRTKDDAELGSLACACAATDVAFDAVVERLHPGVTERDVVWSLLEAFRAAGAEGAAFDSIVAFGPHSSIPHHQPTDRPLQRGDLVKLDFGARVDGYHADMTRTLVCGPALEWQQELHAQVASVQQRCRDATVAGAVPVELDQLAQELLGACGHALVHGLGHGVGLEIHEEPFLVPNSADTALEEGVPLTVEPGVYLPGRGGVRIEDTVVVTVGAPTVLTRSSRELLEL
jgi:Xaa-Pro aminopeptidase